MSVPDDLAAEETTDPDYADERGFYKVELWDKADLRPIKLLHAGNRIVKARPDVMSVCHSHAHAVVHGDEHADRANLGDRFRQRI
jgi:hypothetical protein